ncbi:mucin-13-like [Oncorhynchus kisutch]|nr:mucin-13-like [Oncorhynchus kisutch]
MASPVGTSMLCSLSRYSRYISVLDADRKTLRCPGYRGTLLANVADHRTRLRRGSTYFLHLQNVLSRLASRAFLLSFTHHLHLPISHLEQRQEVEERTRGFLRDQLRLGEDDCSILMYLSQLITQHYLDSTSVGAVTTQPHLEKDNTPGTNQQHLDSTSVGAVTTQPHLEKDNTPGTTQQDLEANNILDPATGGAITPEQYLDPTTGGTINPEQYLDPTTGGTITPETGLDPTTGGTINQQDPESNTGGRVNTGQYLDPTTGGAITPEQYLNPSTGGAITPEQYLDPTTGGAITPEQYLDPTIHQSATRSRAPPSFTFNYTTSLLYKI